jgi:hypothetical protein
MALQPLKQPKFVPPRESIESWDTWKKGLNLLLRESEVGKDEMVTAQNLMLVGSGVPTKRWGSQDHFLAGATGYGRLLAPVTQDSTGTQEILAMTDWGILVKKSGASYTPITGISWASGYDVGYTQLGGNVYLISQHKELVKYNFNTLTSFSTLAVPTGLSATPISTVSGFATWSWTVTAIGKVGETTQATRYSLGSLPQDLSTTAIRLTWTPVSAASGDLTGYNVYRGALGRESWIGGTNPQTTSFEDRGGSGDPYLFPPLINTTGGPKGKYIIRFQDRLVIAGIPGDPTKVIISGRYPDHEKFDGFYGGGYTLIEPDSGEAITGLATYYQSSTNSQTIIVFKERSVWELRIGIIEVDGFGVLSTSYRLLTASQGCSSHYSIVAVENDIMFANRKGIYALRYQPQLINVINANEMSAKIKSFFEQLSDTDLTTASAAYIDKKYVLSFKESKKTIIFDRERLSFMGPWLTPFGIARWAKYVDSSGTEHWIAIDSDDQFVTEFGRNYLDDKGSVITTIFKSRKADFGDWTLFKTLNEVFMNFRAVVGTIEVNIYIEDRTGRTVTAKTFSITATTAQGSSGIGVHQLGSLGLGLTEGTAVSSTDEVPRKAFIYKPARYMQIEIRTQNRTDNYELLGVKSVAIPQSRGNNPSSWNVS